MAKPVPLSDNYTSSKNIILFDGVCNLCNAAVTFVIKKDKKDQFYFASLQNQVGKSLLDHYTIDPAKTDSIILITTDKKVYTKSTAALYIARDLGGWIKALYFFIGIPQFFRDKIYDFIAKNRYRWFGRKQQCMLPSPKLKNKFLDN